MKRKNYKAVFLKVLVLVLIFALGLATGGYIVYRIGVKPLLHTDTLFRLGMATEYARYQYRNAGYPEAKEALLKAIYVFDDLKKKGRYDNNNIVSDKKYYIDTGLAFARLSLLEEKRGNIVERDKFMQQSVDRFKRAGWMNYSEQRIREVVKIKDRMFRVGSEYLGE